MTENRITLKIFLSKSLMAYRVGLIDNNKSVHKEKF